MNIFKSEEYGTDTSFIIINSNLDSCLMKCVVTGQKLKNTQAQTHLIYGAGRRFDIIQLNFHGIAKIADQKRTAPLANEEQTELNMHLNSLYLHVRGVIDNLAWALSHESGILGTVDESSTKDRRKVGLFNSDFQKKLIDQFDNLCQILMEKKEWSKTLKDLRDPIANRIPLYAVPAVVDAEEAKEYEDKLIQMTEAINNLDFKRSDSLFEELNRIGTYSPVFHHSDDSRQSIYPVNVQVEQDLDHLTELTQKVLNCLE